MSELFMKIFNKVFRCYKLYSLELDKETKNFNLITEISDFEIKILTLMDTHYFNNINLYRKGYKQIVMKRLSNENYICMILLDKKKNKLAYFNWIKKRQHILSEIGETLILNPREYLFLDDYTLPAYRGRGLHTYMMNERLKYCLENDANRVYILIMCFNTRAIRTIEKYGFRIKKSFFTLRGINI